MDSSRTPERETTPDLQFYISEKLNGAIFSGWYTERIWIEDLKTYLDEIRIDEDEVQMNKNLRSVNRRVKKLRPGFTGIERSNDQIRIYVDWSNHSKIIGHYWFMIDSAHLGPYMQFNLRILRPVSANEKSTSSGKCPHCGKLPICDTNTTTLEDPLNLSEIARNLQWKFRDLIAPSEWWTEVKPHLTLENVFRFGKFLIVLLLAAISGAGNFLVNLASHTDKFVHALSGLMRSSTPFLIACLDVLNRLIAGLFTLIAMIWRDVRRPQGQSPQETASRLAYERNEAKRKFLEYRNVGNRPYFKNE